MKYLVVGSDGQIGSHLVEYLQEQGNSVSTFDIVSSIEQDLRIHKNPLLKQKMQECDFVYFLAFDVGGSRYLKKYQNTFDFINNNTKIMDTTFSCLRETGKPFLFASSQMSNMDYSSYGTQKRIGEYYTDVLGGITVKFWNVYGVEKDETKSHVITDFIQKALNVGIIDMMTDGSEERQFLYANDCCECLYKLSLVYSSLSRNEQYHITNFKWTKIIDIANHISDIIPCKVIPSITKDLIQNNMRNEPDCSILKYWNPNTDIKQGITNMCNYYKNLQKKEI
jgi:nucleoside-diphosphate-sugar epimerase